MKKTISHVTIITALALLLCFLCGNHNTVFGSVIDWFSQHTAFPNYFRTHFYETGQLFPSFAASLGGGQNIYHYAYYGLDSPLILFSYLLPMVKMTDYMLVMSICLIVAGGILTYFWLKSRGFSANISFLVALLYITAGPVIYHSHRHLMFVNYLPFLIMAMWGVDRHFDKNKNILLCLSTFLMIMTSFYYSIGGILALVIYGIYRYLEVTDEKSFRAFFKAGIYFVCPLLIAVLLSAFLLLPSFYALLGGRTSGGKPMLLSHLLFPQMNAAALVGSAYAIGLTGVVLVCFLFYLMKNKGKTRFLSISLLVIFSIPIFSYMLNGGLYIRNKVFIPFLPLMCFMLALFFRDIFSKSWNKKDTINLVISFILTIAVFLFGKSTKEMRPILLIDSIIFMAGWVLYQIFKKPIVCCLPIVLCSAILCYTYNTNETYISKTLYSQVVNKNIKHALDTVLKKEPLFYRTDNLFEVRDTVNRIYAKGQNLSSSYSSAYLQDYKKFASSVMQNEYPIRNKLVDSVSFNPLYLRFMGVKYIVIPKAPATLDASDASNAPDEPIASTAPTIPAGYRNIYEEKGVSIFQNDNVLPLGYVTNQTISEKQLMQLGYPFRGECLQSFAATTHGPTIKFESHMKPYISELSELPEGFATKKFSILKNENGYVVSAKSEQTINLPITKLKKGNMLFISMKINRFKSYKNDITININGINNVLTDSRNLYYSNHNDVFHFAVSSSIGSISNLKITFGTGKYKISDIKAFELNGADIGGASNRLGDFVTNKKATKGDIIAGTVDAKKDGLFVSSLPYDRSFTVFVDKKAVAIHRVNTAFIGFPIEKGNHDIKFVYHAPGLSPGLAISFFGIFALAAMIFLENRMRKKKQA